ncbi:MAG: ABC transporter permease [Nitrosotalea sp.]
MRATDVFSFSFEALADRKTRTILTILMVVLGSSLVVVIDGLGAGQSAFLEKKFSSLATDVIFVRPGEHSYYGGGPSQASLIINDVIVNRLKNLPYVSEVVPQYTGSVTIDSYGNIQRISVTGMDPTKLTVELPNLELVPGSTIDPNSRASAAVGDTVANPPGATTPFVTVGQTLKVTFSYSDPAGKQLQESRNFLVTAVMKPSGNDRIDNSLVINPDAANQLLKKSGRYDFLVVKAVSDSYAKAVQDEITGMYGQNLRTIFPHAIMQIRQQATSGNAIFIEMIGIISLVVGSVGIVTTLYNSVTERIREIGTMKAMGAQNTSILAIFLVEAALIGIMGATLGVSIGIMSGYLFSSLSPSQGPSFSITSFPPIYYPADIVRVWILSVVLAIAAGIFPAWKASRLTPLDALRRD